MEILAILFILFSVWVFFKILSAGVLLITIPLKIIGAIVFSVIMVILAIPLGIVSGLIGLLAIPFAILIPLAPVVLVLAGIYLLLKNS